MQIPTKIAAENANSSKFYTKTLLKMQILSPRGAENANSDGFLINFLWRNSFFLWKNSFSITFPIKK